MRYFEIIGSTQSMTAVHDYQLPLWSAAFGRDLDGLFDITPAVDAIPVLDAAIAMLNTGTEDLRALLAPEDWQGLRGNRRLLEGIRAVLADDPTATISGVIDDEAAG